MEIEYAKVMTKEERNKFFEYIKNKTTKEDENKNKILIEYKKQLIDEYRIALSNIERQFYLENLTYDSKLLAEKNNKCICGGEVVVRNGQFGQFLSCNNYFDKAKDHWVSKGYELYKPTLRVDMNYLTNIIKKVGLKGKLTSKKLLEFYENNGLTCLRELAGNGNSRKHIDSFTETKRKTAKFESEMTDELSKKYPICIPQMGIEYRLKGDRKTKRCFLDIIYSNDKEVIIYECKTHKMYEDEVQKQLYIALIRYLEKKGRKISFHYLIETE